MYCSKYKKSMPIGFPGGRTWGSEGKLDPPAHY